jgi:ABC-type Co2+ transport system permease subunit
MHVESVGAVLFGVVIGWVTYRTLRRSGPGAKVSDLATVLGAVGGAAVTAIFPSGSLFGWYSIGLAGGFFGYLVLGHTLLSDSTWLGDGS